MKYTIYEDPLTHRFAFLPLPNGFVDGDTLPIVAATDRWFGSLEEATAALPELLNREEEGRSESGCEETSPHDGRAPHVKYPRH